MVGENFWYCMNKADEPYLCWFLQRIEKLVKMQCDMENRRENRICTENEGYDYDEVKASFPDICDKTERCG